MSEMESLVVPVEAAGWRLDQFLVGQLSGVSRSRVQQRIHQRSAASRFIGGARAGVDHHPGRLVHHRQIFILVDDLQWNIFRPRLQRSHLLLSGHDHALAAA